MRNNEFYRGVLTEIRSLEKTSSVTPSSGITQQSPPLGKPLSSAQNPMNLGVGRAGPEANQAVSSFMSLPKSDQDNFLQMGANKITGDKNSFGQVMHFANPLNNPIELQNFKRDYSVLKTPEQQMQFAQSLSRVNPGAAETIRGAATKATDNKMRNASFSDMIGMATNNKDPIAKGLMNDPQIRNHAMLQGLSRSGQLVGHWLTDNWKGLALALGGTTVLMTLLKYLMSSNQHVQAQPHNVSINAPQSF